MKVEIEVRVVPDWDAEHAGICFSYPKHGWVTLMAPKGTGEKWLVGLPAHKIEFVVRRLTATTTVEIPYYTIRRKTTGELISSGRIPPRSTQVAWADDEWRVDT